MDATGSHLQCCIIVAGSQSSLPLLTANQPSQDMLLEVSLNSGKLSLESKKPGALPSLAKILHGNTLLHKLHLQSQLNVVKG